jgi:4'-phosphopantetheinyl transferase
MPIVFEKALTEETTIGLWEISENEDKFNGILGKTTIPDEIKNPKQRLEKLAVRALIKYLTNSDIYRTLAYTDKGKPVFENSILKISISHKRNLAGVIISKTINPGLDIEWKDNKANKLSSKFTTPDELNALTAIDDSFIHTLIWTAKECLYKIDGNKELDFKKHLYLSNENNMLYGHIVRGNLKSRYKLEYFHYENYLITYAL